MSKCLFYSTRSSSAIKLNDLGAFSIGLHLVLVRDWWRGNFIVLPILLKCFKHVTNCEILHQSHHKVKCEMPLDSPSNRMTLTPWWTQRVQSHHKVKCEMPLDSPSNRVTLTPWWTQRVQSLLIYALSFTINNNSKSLRNVQNRNVLSI